MNVCWCTGDIYISEAVLISSPADPSPHCLFLPPFFPFSLSLPFQIIYESSLVGASPMTCFLGTHTLEKATWSEELLFAQMPQLTLLAARRPF